MIPARIIGVIKMLDGGEQDDKLIAIDPDSFFYPVHTLADLQEMYPGVVDILSTWLEFYKRDLPVSIQSVENETVAMDILHRSIEAYQNEFPNP